MTFRSIAAKVNYSHSILARAERGLTLPSPLVLKALLQAFRATADEINQWLSYLQETAVAAKNIEDKRASSTTRLTVAHSEAAASGGRCHFTSRSDVESAGRDTVTAIGRARFDQLAAAQSSESRLPSVDPRTIRTHDQLVVALRRLRLAVGNPTYRALESTSARGNAPVSRSTLANVLNGRRRPSRQSFEATASACRLASHGAGCSTWNVEQRRVAGWPPSCHVTRAEPD